MFPFMLVIFAYFSHVSLRVVTMSSDLRKHPYKATLFNELGHLTF